MYDADGVEFDHDCNPVALVELKHGYGLTGKGTTVDCNDRQFKCLSKMVSLLNVPFFCVVYFPAGLDDLTGKTFGDHWQFWVYPRNQLACALLDGCATQMTERQYVSLLHQVRGLEVPPTLPLDDTRIDVPQPVILG